MTWVYALPVWAVYGLILAIASTFSVGGLLIARGIGENAELTHNDVVGPIIGTLGTILAVTVSFLLVSVWQEYDAAAATVAQEASAIGDLNRLAPHFPESLGRPLEKQLHAYVVAVIDLEWPAMRDGEHSETARIAVRRVLDLIASFRPSSASQQTLQQQTLSLAITMQDARRSRLFANQQGIPAFFWVGNVLLAAITIACCFIFRVRSQTVHVLMTLALSTVVATTFCLIALFDYPFRGQTQLAPTQFIDLERASWPSRSEHD